MIFRKIFFCILVFYNGFLNSVFVFGNNTPLINQESKLLFRLNSLKYVSIVFASQNLNSPISSFGHTLLIFHNNAIPETDSLTFEYLGNKKVPFFALRALIWSIPGTFQIRLWEQRQWEYEKEDRDLWVIPLKLTKHERQQLNIQVKKLLSSTQTKSYNFLFKNCSWAIFDVLKTSMDDMHCQIKPYVLPIDTLRTLYQCERIGQPYYIPAQATRLVQSMKGLSLKEKAFITNLPIWKLDPKHVSSHLRSAITEWIGYKIPRTDRVDERHQLFLLKKHYHHPIQVDQKDLKEIKNPRSGRLTVLQTNKDTTLTIAPAQLRFLSASNNAVWTDKLEIMAISLTFKTKKIFLSGVDLLNFSMSSSEHVLKFPFLKDIYLGYQRYLIGYDEQQFLARLGFGVSYKLTDYWKISILSFLETGFFGFENSKKVLFARIGLAGRMFIKYSSWLRSKIEFRPIITQNDFIYQIGNAQIIFYDYKSFVVAFEYSGFHLIKANNLLVHQMGLSLTYLF